MLFPGQKDRLEIFRPVSFGHVSIPSKSTKLYRYPYQCSYNQFYDHQQQASCSTHTASLSILLGHSLNPTTNIQRNCADRANLSMMSSYTRHLTAVSVHAKINNIEKRLVKKCCCSQPAKAEQHLPESAAVTHTGQALYLELNFIHYIKTNLIRTHTMLPVDSI